MKKSMVTLVWLIACTVFSFTAYAQNSETRNLKSFSEVHVGGAFDVVLAKGDKESVNIESSTLELDKIETEVEGKSLKVRLKKGTYRNTGNIKIHITYRDLTAIHSSGSSNVVCNSPIQADDFQLHTSGSGKVKLASLTTNALDIHNSGSSNVDLAGSAKRQNISISGSSKINAFDLKCEESKVSISGSGDVNISVSQNLEARVSGSGDIRYKGDPNIRDVRVSGSGNIRKVN
jgi:hypothetical protein